MAEHTRTSEITCPYCDHEFSDSWECGDGDDIECRSCEKTFEYERHYDVYYSTRRKDCERHSYALPTVSKITQETADRWNRDWFMRRSDHKPHDLWKRQCKNCEHAEHQELPPNSEDPWGKAND